MRSTPSVPLCRGWKAADIGEAAPARHAEHADAGGIAAEGANARARIHRQDAARSRSGRRNTPPHFTVPGVGKAATIERALAVGALTPCRRPGTCTSAPPSARSPQDSASTSRRHSQTAGLARRLSRRGARAGRDRGCDRAGGGARPAVADVVLSGAATVEQLRSNLAKRTLTWDADLSDRSRAWSSSRPPTGQRAPRFRATEVSGGRGSRPCGRRGPDRPGNRSRPPPAGAAVRCPRPRPRSAARRPALA
jgi:hypothetical protein